MSTPAYVEQVSGIVGTGAKLYRDKIMDDGFVGLFDFKSDYCRAGYVAGAVPLGKTFKNLVDGGGDATVKAAYGGLTNQGLYNSDGVAKLQLPEGFRLPDNETHFAFCIWFKRDLSWVINSVGTVSLGGYGYQTGNNSRYSLAASTNANGTLSALRLNFDGRAALDFPPAVRDAVFDGNVHQLIGEVEVLPGGAFTRRRGYFDGALVAEIASDAHDGALNDPNSGAQAGLGHYPMIGNLGGFATPGARGHIARTWLKRWSLGGAGVDLATIAALEWQRYGATPRFS